jgi:hypothetical protein
MVKVTVFVNCKIETWRPWLIFFSLEFGLMAVTNEALNTWKCKAVHFHDRMAYRRTE